ncbi:MAG: DUF433 domain-containing protein [Rhizobiaceae bacterium]|jgi:uncharacterized protein (DUF433 family)
MKRNKGSEIVTDPAIRFGKPTIRGTRITVEDVLRLASRGLSSSEIQREYPHLTETDIRAAHQFAADHLRDAFASSPEAAE